MKKINLADLRKKVVYSTNPDYKPEEENDEPESVASNKQTLYVALERLKGGKVATIVSNFMGPDAELEKLGKELKNKCGVGGTVKDGIILIQGEQRERVIGILEKMGYKTKRKGG